MNFIHPLSSTEANPSEKIQACEYLDLSAQEIKDIFINCNEF